MAKGLALAIAEAATRPAAVGHGRAATSSAVIGLRVPGAAQHVVMRCRPGTPLTEGHKSGSRISSASFRSLHAALHPGHASHLLQRPQQILDQIVGVLEPDRQAHQPVADAELGALRRRQPLMRGGGRMRDQALGVAEIVGDGDQLEPIEEAEGAFLAALDLERDQVGAGASSAC